MPFEFDSSFPRASRLATKTRPSFFPFSKVTGYQPVLKTVQTEPIHSTSSLAIGCGGFPDEAAAKSPAERVRDALSICGVDLQIGVDVGKGKTIVGLGNVIREMAEKHGFQILNDIHGIQIYRDDIPTSHVTGHPASLSLRYSKDRFESGIHRAYQLSGSIGARTRTALEVFNSSFFEGTDSARFVTTVTALEVLAEKEHSPTRVIEVIDDLKGRVRELMVSETEKEERDRLLDRLGDLKRESISHSIKGLIDRHVGGDRASFFTDIYGIRSRMLHDGDPRMQRTGIQGSPPQFCGDCEGPPVGEVSRRGSSDKGERPVPWVACACTP